MLLPTVKVFTTGNSQAVRLPKAFRVNTREMWMSHQAADINVGFEANSSEIATAAISLLPAYKNMIQLRDRGTKYHRLSGKLRY